MASEKQNCFCRLRSFFSPVYAPPCKPERGLFSWRKCFLPDLPKGVSDTCPFRPLLTVGLFWIEIFKKLFIPSTVFVVHAKEKDKPPECEQLVKAVDLPVYTELENKEKKDSRKCVNDNSVLITTIRCMRLELSVFMEQVDVVKEQLIHIYNTGKAHTQETLDYLREPDNVYPRVGAITAGALTGYLLAIRKGRFKKLLGLGAGGGAVAAFIFPDQAKNFSDDTSSSIKRYFVIAYHFLNGVSRDLTGWELPALSNGGPLHHSNTSGSESHMLEGSDSVPEPSHLLPPKAGATHLHIHPEDEGKH